MAAIGRVLLLLNLSLFLILMTHSQTAKSFGIKDEEDDSEEYVLDAPFVAGGNRLRSRFLASIKKGHQCDARSSYKNVCNGIWANKGTSLLYCCKKHCRNVLGDMNNCGQCGRKCKMNERCCNGYCINVLYNPEHCGKCNGKCSRGQRCEYGYCGYA
ncbi:hypothetical protein M9H77_21872 [Catharanthus roseus]|uniref:Uncharacterized protein n=1 Tax=Catharanthus roseus TaxID=4058 RepID=A0ACC0AQW2_CATRO|nr:hypothetical protein M9H77_21872 [Catharanthus roseus]